MGKDTALAQIVALVEAAQMSKAPIQAFADYVSSVFVPVVVAMAALTWFFWCAKGFCSTVCSCYLWFKFACLWSSCQGALMSVLCISCAAEQPPLPASVSTVTTPVRRKPELS